MFEQAPSKCPESPVRRNDAALCAAPGRPHCDPGSRASPLVLGLVLFAAACSFESGSDDPPRVALDPADRELARFLDGLLDAALTNPGDAEARGRLAIGYEMNDFDDAAVVAYRQAEALDPREFRWPYFLALLAAGQGNPEAALDSLDRALALDADYAPAWLWKASLLRDLGDDDAGTAYRRARELGEEVHAVVGLAQLALRRSQPDDALALLESVERADWHPQVFRTLGRAYQALGRTDDARIAMARGRDPEPLRWQDPRLAMKSRYIMSQGGLLALAEEAMKAKDFETAVSILAPLRARFPDDKALLGNLAIAYGRLGRARQAFDVLRHAFTVHSEHWPFHNAMATVLEETGDRDRARDHLEQSLELNPAQAWVHEKLGRMWMENGDYDKALARFHDAVQYGIDKPATVLHLAGSIEGARERWQEAIAYFERAVALDESHAAAYVHLALCLAEVGRLDEATAALDWAEKIGTRPREVAGARARLAGPTNPASVDAGAPRP
ncbi:MAG: tetratricopeptide repeat protein [Gammaproteobacteria bacterium]|nr:tetratricopeptide repeat protein [Gammaproteobacteria bacterium]